MKKYDCLVLGGCSFGVKPFDTTIQEEIVLNN